MGSRAHARGPSGRDGSHRRSPGRPFSASSSEPVGGVVGLLCLDEERETTIVVVSDAIGGGADGVSAEVVRDEELAGVVHRQVPQHGDGRQRARFEPEPVLPVTRERLSVGVDGGRRLGRGLGASRPKGSATQGPRALSIRSDEAARRTDRRSRPRWRGTVSSRSPVVRASAAPQGQRVRTRRCPPTAPAPRNSR